MQSDIQLIMIPPAKLTEGCTTQQQKNNAIIDWANRFNEFMKDVNPDKKGLLIVQPVKKESEEA